MAEKNREKKCNKEKYLKKQRKKKKLKAERRDRKISRDARNQIRHAVEPTFLAFRKLIDKDLLFVVKDTANMEKVLLKKVDLGNGKYLLTLPVLNEKMVNDYLENINYLDPVEKNVLISNDVFIRDLINYYYSIKVDNITRMDQSNMFIFRDCDDSRNNNLIEVNVRPYNLLTWYKNEATTLCRAKIYKGKKLKTFFKLDESIDCANTYVLHDTIIELLLYKAMMNKVNALALLRDIRKLSYKETLSTAGLYEVMSFNFEELYERFKDEDIENEELDKAKQLRK